MAIKTYKNYIDGKWVVSSSGDTFDDINPANKKEILGRFQKSNADDLNKAVKSAVKATASSLSQKSGKTKWS